MFKNAYLGVLNEPTIEVRMILNPLLDQDPVP